MVNPAVPSVADGILHLWNLVKYALAQSVVEMPIFSVMK
jgi:hypothetical protein